MPKKPEKKKTRAAGMKTVHLEPDVYQALVEYCGKTRKIGATVNELLADVLGKKSNKTCK